MLSSFICSRPRFAGTFGFFLACAISVTADRAIGQGALVRNQLGCGNDVASDVSTASASPQGFSSDPGNCDYDASGHNRIEYEAPGDHSWSGWFGVEYLRWRLDGNWLRNM